MTLIRPFCVMLIVLVAWSCQSPLSNTDITDPSSIQPRIQVIKDTDTTGTIYEYRADIYDQQSRYIELKDGSVTVDGEQLILVRDIFGSYYLTDDHIVKYRLNTQYNFTVTLSDNSQYAASVITPSTELSDFAVPPQQLRTDPMPVSWLNRDTSATMYFGLTIYFRTDTSQGVQTRQVVIANPRPGSFELQPSDYLASQGISTSVDITLNSESDGQIDPRFYYGSRAYFHQLITKTVILQ